MLADDCYRLEEMNNSGNVKIQMTAEQIFKEIEALPRSERERLVQRMRESADIPQDFIDALDDFNQQRFVSMETALNETPPDALITSTARSRSSGGTFTNLGRSKKNQFGAPGRSSKAIRFIRH